jgi:hypothetical protein
MREKRPTCTSHRKHRALCVEEQTWIVVWHTLLADLLTQFPSSQHSASRLGRTVPSPLSVVCVQAHQ